MKKMNLKITTLRNDITSETRRMSDAQQIQRQQTKRIIEMEMTKTQTEQKHGELSTTEMLTNEMKKMPNE